MENNRTYSATTAPMFTTRNASTFSAFEIRQELNRRNAFDFNDDDEVNYRNLLRRLMAELVKEEDMEAEKRGKQKEEETVSAIEVAKKARELKKQEALERSKLRQAHPQYFKQKAELNTPLPNAEPVKEVAVEDDDTTNCDEGDNIDDPFRSYKPKGRPKIFVK